MYCVALFCGIPGCGKTELLNYILADHNLFDSFHRSRTPTKHGVIGDSNEILSPEIHLISIDQLCCVEDQAKIISTMHGWKNFRIQLVEAAEHYICEVCKIQCNLQGPLTLQSKEILEKLRELNAGSRSSGKKANIVFLVEDNFYYTSMRYQWFQVAKRDGLGFCQVYLTCPIEVALERNTFRGGQIPECVIKDMFSVMEYPEPEKNKWEKHSMVYDSTSELECSRLFPIIELITTAIKEPVQITLNKDKFEAQCICSKSVIHQADKILRKIAGEVIKSMKVEKKHSCKSVEQVIECRKRLLSELKQGSLGLPQDIANVIKSSGIDNNDSSARLEDFLRELMLEKCSLVPDGLSMVEPITSATKEPVQMTLNNEKVEAQTIYPQNMIYLIENILSKIVEEFFHTMKVENEQDRYTGIQPAILCCQELLLESKVGPQHMPQDVTDIIKRESLDKGSLSKLKDLLRELLLKKCNLVLNG